MKLELKHYLAYLPYNVEYYLPLDSPQYEFILDGCYWISAFSGVKEAIAAGIKDAEQYKSMTLKQEKPQIMWEDDRLFLGQMKTSLGFELDDVFADEVKMLLRPLSDLTKEMTVNGETFVPIMKIFGGDNYSTYEYIINVIDRPILGKRIVISVKDVGEICFGLKHPLNNSLAYKNFQQLLEWHFDIFGLIDAGLAVDINTI